MVGEMMDMAGEMMDMIWEMMGMDMVGKGAKGKPILPGILGIPGIPGVLRQCRNFHDVLKLESDFYITLKPTVTALFFCKGKNSVMSRPMEV